MANIIAYPIGTVKPDDLILGTSVPTPNTTEVAKTNNFKASSISQLGMGYTSYVATFSQSSTSDPVAVELSNTTGLTFAWTRVTPGTYKIVPSSSMVGGLWWSISGYTSELEQVAGGGFDAVGAELFKVDTSTGVKSDGITQGNVEIRIY